MADTTDVKTVYSGRYVVLHLQNRSDGTGESAVIKATPSNYTTRNGTTATYFTVDRIEYDCSGMTVQLNFTATTPDELATLGSSGVLDWSAVGGLTDPKSSGWTGTIKLTTNGHTSGDTYDITLWLRPKA